MTTSTTASSEVNRMSDLSAHSDGGKESERSTTGTVAVPNVVSHPRNFYSAFKTNDPCESCDESVSIGARGTFRAQAMARRFVNTSRRNLLKQQQGISMQSLLSSVSGHTQNELQPLNNVDIPENERVTNFDTKSKINSKPTLGSVGGGGYGSLRSSFEDSMVSNKIPEEKRKKGVNIWINFALIWIGKPICLLLLFFPFALASHFLNWGPQWVFWLNFLAMVPLASILGDFTEEAALHTNDVIGGLLNASFGNAVEVVVAFNALMKDQIRVVQASMIGSIFSNLLFVLGCCFAFGGVKYKEQKFSSMNVTTGMGLLALSSIGMVLPTPFAEYYEIEDPDVLIISRTSASFLLFSYMLMLYFQLFTHREVLEGLGSDEENQNDGEEEEEATIPMLMALTGLGATTLLVSKLSDYLVDSIDGLCEESGISHTFVGLIILPIVGNAVEHITAVSVAMKNKMELAIGVAVGSCTQIALFVVPVVVIFGWCVDKPMTLNYPGFEIQLYILSIFTVSVCLNTGKSNWLLGSVLVITYFMIAIGFWFERIVDF